MRQLAAEIKQRFGRAHRLFLLSNQDFKEEIYRLIDQSFVITYALEIIAIAVGLLGIATALYTSVLERQRETSVLRALAHFGTKFARSLCSNRASWDCSAWASGPFVGRACQSFSSTLSIDNHSGGRCG